MPERIPRWFLNLVLGGSGALGVTLVSVLLYIWTGVSGRVSSAEETIFKHDQRIHTLEVAVPLELQQLKEDASRTRRLVEAMAAKQGVVAQ